MAPRKRRTLAQKRDKAHSIVAEQVHATDEALERVERLLKGYEPIIEERNRLRSARRALLGGTRATGGGGSTVRQEDVVADLREHPGSSSAAIAKRLGATRQVVTGHLYRGKDERFLRKGEKYWLRSPKDGVNTVDDIEEDE